MKYISVIFILCLPCFLFAQNTSFSPEGEDLFAIPKQQNKFFLGHVKIDINNTMFDGTNYIEARISPFFKLENIYFGFSLPLQILTDSGGIANFRDYTYASNYLQFLQIVKYILPDNSFIAEVSSLSKVSLGQGLLMSNFRNDVFLPQIREQGFYSSGQWKYAGYQYFTSDITNWGFGGGELRISPFAFSKNDYLNSWDFLAGFLYDADSLHQIWANNYGKINHSINRNSPIRYAYTVSSKINILDLNNLLISTSIEYANIYGEQKNYSGLLGSMQLHYKYYHLNIGLAYLFNGLCMNFFSALYLEPTNRANKIEKLSTNQNQQIGYKIENSFSFLKDSLTFGIDIYGQNLGFSYGVSFELKPYVLSQLSLLFVLISENINSFSDLSNFSNSKNILISQIAYRFSDNTQLAFFYRRGFNLLTSNTTEPYNELSVKVSLII